MRKLKIPLLKAAIITIVKHFVPLWIFYLVTMFLEYDFDKFNIKHSKYLINTIYIINFVRAGEETQLLSPNISITE